VSPEETLDIGFGGLNLLAPRHKPASHVDNPDIRVVVMALNAADVESGSGEKSSQTAVMEQPVEIALGQEFFQRVRRGAASIWRWFRLSVVYRHSKVCLTFRV
jgi:hypothetical protein